jgi:hypothetical protein
MNIIEVNITIYMINPISCFVVMPDDAGTDRVSAVVSVVEYEVLVHTWDCILEVMKTWKNGRKYNVRCQSAPVRLYAEEDEIDKALSWC